MHFFGSYRAAYAPLVALILLVARVKLTNGQSCRNLSSNLYKTSRQCEYDTLAINEFYCEAYSACSGVTLTKAELAYVYCRGVAACINLKTSDTANINHIDCNGYLACANIIANITQLKVNDIESPFVECEGALGCANMQVSGSVSHLYDVNAPPANTTVTPATAVLIRAYGYGAAAGMNAMHGEVYQLWARGYFAFYKGKLRMSDQSKVEMQGRLTGYQAYILCPAGYECVVECNNFPTACYGLTFDCETPSTCAVTGCDESDGIWCPSGTWSDQFNSSDPKSQYYNYFNNDLIFYPLNMPSLDTDFIPDISLISSASQASKSNLGFVDNVDIIDTLISDGNCLKSLHPDDLIILSPTQSVAPIVCSDRNSCNKQNISYDAIGSNSNKAEFWYNTSYASASALCALGYNNFRSVSSSDHFSVDLGCNLDLMVAGMRSGFQSDAVHKARHIFTFGDRAFREANELQGGCSENIDGFASELWCLGQESCSFVERVSGFERVFCLGETSCDKSKLEFGVDGGELFSLGYSSLSFANVSVFGGNLTVVIDSGLFSDPAVNVDVCDAQESVNVLVYCFEPQLKCGRNVFVKCAKNDTLKIVHYQGQIISRTSAPTKAPTSEPSPSPLDLNGESGENEESEKKGSNSDEIDMNAVYLGIGIGAGVILLILIIFCIIVRDRWLWIPEYVIAVCRNMKYKKSTRAVTSNVNVLNTDTKWDPNKYKMGQGGVSRNSLFVESNKGEGATPGMNHSVLKSSSLTPGE